MTKHLYSVCTAATVDAKKGGANYVITKADREGYWILGWYKTAPEAYQALDLMFPHDLPNVLRPYRMSERKNDHA
jgi:hypothetical protein